MTKEQINKQLIGSVAIREVEMLLERLDNGEVEGMEYAISGAMASIAVTVTNTFGHTARFGDVIRKAKEAYAEKPLPTATWR